MWIWQMRQNFVLQFFQLVKRWLCNVQSGIVMEQNWALSVNQCQRQALQFLVHLIDLLSILLRCNGFAGIQKAAVDQTDSRPPVTMALFWCKFGLGKSFGASLHSNHWAGHHWLYKIQFLLHVTIQSRNGWLLLHRIKEHLKCHFLKFAVSSWVTRLLSFFTFQFAASAKQP